MLNQHGKKWLSPEDHQRYEPTYRIAFMDAFYWVPFPHQNTVAELVRPRAPHGLLHPPGRRFRPPGSLVLKNWLVVDLPLWKIKWQSVGMMKSPIDGKPPENRHVSACEGILHSIGRKTSMSCFVGMSVLKFFSETKPSAASPGSSEPSWESGHFDKNSRYAASRTSKLSSATVTWVSWFTGSLGYLPWDPLMGYDPLECWHESVQFCGWFCTCPNYGQGSRSKLWPRFKIFRKKKNSLQTRSGQK